MNNKNYKPSRAILDIMCEFQEGSFTNQEKRNKLMELIPHVDSLRGLGIGKADRAFYSLRDVENIRDSYIRNTWEVDRILENAEKDVKELLEILSF